LTKLKKSTKNRNTGKSLIILDEDDIVRDQDDFGR
jgi:hypothetical protein